MTTAEAVNGEAWTANDSTFGARLALIRQRKQWGNVKEGAVACGIPVESWRAWERDDVLPRRYLEVCAQIAAATGCDYGWLVDRRPSGGSRDTGRRLTATLTSIEGEGRTSPPHLPMLQTVP